MNIEELKLIVNMLAQLGAEGKEAFIWWLMFDTIPIFILWSAFLGIIGYAVYKGLYLVRDSEDAFLIEMRDALRIGRPGVLSNSERVATKAAIRKLVQAASQ